MDPYQPQTPPPTPGPDFGFIMDTQHQPKLSLQPNHNSTVSRLLITAGVGVLLLIVVLAGKSLLFSTKTGNTVQLAGLIAEQQEIARVADIGVKSASDASVKAFAETTKLSAATQQASLTAYLSGKKQKLTAKQLAAKKNTATDTALTASLSASKFDADFTATIKQLLTSYNDSLDKAYNDASDNALKTQLKNDFLSVEALLK